ncbi:MAG: flagellar hook assembly protein FlgD [Janthinobacterium lividum]
MTSIAPLPIRDAADPSTPTPTGRTTLDQSDFLALMTAQLKNQDPTKPVDNSEYVSQLAQLSTVTGIAQTNTSLTSIEAKLDALLAAKPAA